MVKMARLIVLNFIILLFITSFLPLTQTAAETTTTNNRTFVGTEGKLNTGFVIETFDNESCVVFIAFTLEIVRMYSETMNLSLNDVSLTWGIQQSNLGLTNFTNVYNSTSISFNLDQNSYIKNQTSIIWYLNIHVPNDSSITVEINSGGTVSFSDCGPVYPPDPTVTTIGKENENFQGIIVILVVISIFIILASIIMKRNLKKRK